MAKPTQESHIKRIVRTPMYRMRVEVDRTKYKRNEKHRKKPSQDGYFFCAF